MNDLLKRVASLEALNKSLSKATDALVSKVQQLEARPAGLSGDALWAFVNNTINAAAKTPDAAPLNTPEMLKWTQDRAQETLVKALDYALTHSSSQSKFRAVISSVVTQEMSKS